MKKQTVAVVGATGFVGRNLLEKISKDYNVVAFTRARQSPSPSKRIKWRKVDLFSINETTKALKDVDIVIYLIHSMLPSTRFFQGKFCDVDLLLADNIVRASQANNIKRILYLGGLLPKGYKSPHLTSRQEVEDVFLASRIPTTIVRAGMIIGQGGSSFSILKNLVKKLPLMVLPRWANNTTQIIAIEDVVRSLALCCRRNDSQNKIYNLAIEESVTYAGLLKQVASFLGKKRVFIKLPLQILNFSKLWVALFGKHNMALVSPLVDSLSCDFTGVTASKEIEHMIRHKTVKQVLERSTVLRHKSWLSNLNRYKMHEKTVRSIQRLPSRKDIHSQDIASLYVQWLPAFFHSLIKAKVIQKEKIQFHIFGLCLLELTIVDERSDKNRQLFYITGGGLVKRKDYGWLEFRQLKDKEFTISVIHEFEPQLPWSIYKHTQAPLHEFVMKQFSHYLLGPADNSSKA